MRTMFSRVSFIISSKVVLTSSICLSFEAASRLREIASSTCNFDRVISKCNSNLSRRDEPELLFVKTENNSSESLIRSLRFYQFHGAEGLEHFRMSSLDFECVVRFHMVSCGARISRMAWERWVMSGSSCAECVAWTSREFVTMSRKDFTCLLVYCEIGRWVHIRPRVRK